MSTNEQIKNIQVNSSLIPALRNVPLDGRTRCASSIDFPNISKPYIGMIIYTTEDQKLWIVTTLKSKIIGVTEYPNAQIETVVELSEFLNIINYTQGTGIHIDEDAKVSIDPVFLEKIEAIKTYSGSDNIIIGTDGSIDINTATVALKSDLAQGDATSDYRQLSNKPKFVAGEGINLNYTYAGSLLVTGATDDSCNGIYAPTDYYATGTDRVWAKEGRFIHHSNTAWYIDSDIDTTSFYYSAEGDEDPWTLEFNAALDVLGNPPTVTLIDISKDNDYYDVQVDWNTVAKKSDIKNYSGSTNISISSEGKIDITDQVALASDIVTYKPGAGIAIDTDGTISCSVTPGEPISYTAGDGLLLNNQQFTVDWEKVAKLEDVALKSDIKTYTAGNGLTLTGTSFAVNTDVIASKEYVDGKIGNINSILDAINGEEI